MQREGQKLMTRGLFKLLCLTHKIFICTCAINLLVTLLIFLFSHLSKSQIYMLSGPIVNSPACSFVPFPKPWNSDAPTAPAITDDMAGLIREKLKQGCAKKVRSCPRLSPDNCPTIMHEVGSLQVVSCVCVCVCVCVCARARACVRACVCVGLHAAVTGLMYGALKS